MSSRACNAVMRPAPERPVTTTNGRRVSWEALGREEAGPSGKTATAAITPPRFAPRQGATLHKPTLLTPPRPAPAPRDPRTLLPPPAGWAPHRPGASPPP